MKKLFSIITVSAIALGLPTASFAAEKKAKPAAEQPADAAKKAAEKPADAAKSSAEKVKGTGKSIPLYVEVTTIDAASKTFTHKNKDGKEVKFTVTTATEIKNGEVVAKFEDIKVGDYVSGLRSKKSDTEYEVVKITKFGPKTPKKEGDAKPAEGKPAPKKE